MLGEVARSVAQIVDLSERDFPAGLLPPELRSRLDAMVPADVDPHRFARSLLELQRPSTRTGMMESLQWMTGLRLHALHALVLSEIADAKPNRNATTAAELTSLVEAITARVIALRRAARDAAQALKEDAATTAFALSLWAEIFEFEQWLTDEAASRLAVVASVATARLTDNDGDAERWARETCKGYDMLRQGIAFDAGIRAVLLAYAAHDERLLSDFAKSRALDIGTATADLPRTSLNEVKNTPQGTAIEVAGLVIEADFRIGGPGNRSVLTLGAPDAVKVLVPHVAVNSFGIDVGVWVQVRGQAHPNGKDGIDGPLVMVGRIRRGEAVRESFTDGLIFLGRESFDLRPGDLDLVAGRVAGAHATLNEIGMRR